MFSLCVPKVNVNVLVTRHQHFKKEKAVHFDCLCLSCEGKSEFFLLGLIWLPWASRGLTPEKMLQTSRRQNQLTTLGGSFFFFKTLEMYSKFFISLTLVILFLFLTSIVLWIVFGFVSFCSWTRFFYYITKFQNRIMLFEKCSTGQRWREWHFMICSPLLDSSYISTFGA
jgi:hypothetical protein